MISVVAFVVGAVALLLVVGAGAFVVKAQRVPEDVLELFPSVTEASFHRHILGLDLVNILGQVPEIAPVDERKAPQLQLASFLVQLIVQDVDRSQELPHFIQRLEHPRTVGYLLEAAVQVNHRQPKPQRPAAHWHTRINHNVNVDAMTQHGDRPSTQPQHIRPPRHNSLDQVANHAVAVPRNHHVEIVEITEKPVVLSVPAQSEVDNSIGHRLGKIRFRWVGNVIIDLLVIEPSGLRNERVPAADTVHMRTGRKDGLLSRVLHQTDGARESDISEHRERLGDVGLAHGALSDDAHLKCRQKASRRESKGRWAEAGRRT